MNELSNDIILRAASGEAEALETVLTHYEHYINAVSTESIADRYGQIRHTINEDRKSYIQMRLIEAIMKWRVITDDTAR